MAEKMFNDEYILYRMKARLVPTGDEYPDCVADIILTEKHLYAAEDNFDGTFNVHIKLPLEDIFSIGDYMEEMTKDTYIPGTSRAGGHQPPNRAVESLMALGGVSRGLRLSRAPRDYMRVNLMEEGKSRSIFFEECSDKPKKMGKALKKFREQRGL